MKKISRWASRNKWLSRLLIVVGFLLINVLGIITGGLLRDIDIHIPLWIFYLVIAIYFLAVFFHPSAVQKKQLAPGRFYKKQKTADFIMAATAFCMLACIANDKGKNTMLYSSAFASPVNHPADSSIKTYKTLAAFSASLKDENGKTLKWKERKKLLREQLKAIKKAKDLSEGGKIALIALSVLIALFLLYGVAALACTLSCNGADAAAILIGVGGGFLVVLLLIVVIRSINRKYRKDKLKDERDG